MIIKSIYEMIDNAYENKDINKLKSIKDYILELTEELIKNDNKMAIICELDELIDRYIKELEEQYD